MEFLIWLGVAVLERQPPLASHPYAVPAAVHAHAARAGHERLGRPAEGLIIVFSIFIIYAIIAFSGGLRRGGSETLPSGFRLAWQAAGTSSTR